MQPLLNAKTIPVDPLGIFTGEAGHTTEMTLLIYSPSSPWRNNAQTFRMRIPQLTTAALEAKPTRTPPTPASPPAPKTLADRPRAVVVYSHGLFGQRRFSTQLYIEFGENYCNANPPAENVLK